MLNKVQLIGTLGRDPEIKYLPSGDPVANFSVATSEKWKGKDGQKRDETTWHNIVMFGKVAEIAGEYLKKGSQVYLEGKIKIEEYEKDGVKRQSFKIVCNEMKMLGGKQEGQSKGDSGKAHYDAMSPNKAPHDDFEDSIPF